MRTTGPTVRRVQHVVPVPCPCGESARVITQEDSPNLGLHVTKIQDGEKHYHRLTTEIYYILEGHGQIELEDEVHDVAPGHVVHIPPGVSHRGAGGIKAIIVTTPAFDPADEYICQ